MPDQAKAARAEPFRLGAWSVVPELNRIERAGGEIRQLEPKVMRVLVHLASRPGQVIGQDELIDVVWGGIAVSPNVLTYSIAALRKALDDDWRAPRYVETISKSGYRLVEQVVRAESVRMSATGAGSAVGAPAQAGEISGIDATVPLASGRDDSPPRAGNRGALALALAAGAALAIVAFAMVFGVGEAEAPAAPLVLLQPVPATALPGLEIHPALSPDGNHLAFAWRREEGDDYDLYVKLVGSEAPALLVDTAGEDVSPAWTPDGLQIAYVTRGPPDDCGVFLIPATGGASRHLADCPGRPIGNLSLSPDNTLLAMGAGVAAGGPTRIFVIDLTTGASRTLGDPAPTDQGDYYPMFSPDGARISFQRIRGDGLHDLYVADAAGGEARRVTFDNRDIGGHDWLDDDTLLFSSYRTGLFRVWTIELHGGDPQPVAINDHQMTSVSVSRAGNRLAYYRANLETNLWSVTITGEGTLVDAATVASVDAILWASHEPPTQLLSSTRWEAHPELSNDGSRVAFVSDRSGTFELWSANLDGTAPLRHTSFEGPFVSAPRFSPDGAHIVFDARPDGHADLWVADARGTGLRRLTDDPADEFAASFSRDGGSIYFTSSRSGAWEIWRMPADGGEATQVTTTGGYRALEGSDGYLYWAKPDTPGIWRAVLEPFADAAGANAPGAAAPPATADVSGGRALRPGTEQQVVSYPLLIDWGSWTVTDRGLVLVMRNPDAIVRFDPEVSLPVPLVPLPGPPLRHHPALTASVDGRLLIYAQVDRRETDIMLVEGIR